jgi:hypothetical protein
MFISTIGLGVYRAMWGKNGHFLESLGPLSGSAGMDPSELETDLPLVSSKSCA